VKDFAIKINFNIMIKQLPLLCCDSFLEFFIYFLFFLKMKTYNININKMGIGDWGLGIWGLGGWGEDQ